ncbi:DUF4247 domain-containing protein [Bacillus sp. RAR_GA_16]|uniref:DUF4247 domain-containing protein n=1 Tax=Bacillus sp. RAR_GA_16 TaxID=2876774 RepID=UPI001CCB7169|nr:DUF4247 domain-containing protein [Bacillus sp. RAR_GA_16]MCA0171586.1 DUF4247 domain-containing protein [Bacillus sp. RAR_GA_16]
MKGLTGLLAAFILLLSACGITKDIQEIVEDRYQLEDVVESSVDSSDVSKVYSAEEDIPSVASYLQEQIKPNEVSELKDGKQILVYDDYIVTLEDRNDDSTTVEVATVGFVRDNYRPSFFDGLLAYYILDEILDVDDWGKKQKNRCLNATGNCYEGYGSTGGSYKGPTTIPSFRGSSRGGGPGTGK